MNVDTDTMAWRQLPVFLEDANNLCGAIKEMSYGEAKALWGCNDNIATLNYERFKNLELTTNLTPAILTYEGLCYQYMAPSVFSEEAYEYVEANLRILSGFYGILSPFDGVVPYRLEMQAKMAIDGKRSLYAYWGDRLYKELVKEDDVIINLASKEYSRAIEKYVTKDVQFITCTFGEVIKGKIVQKSAFAKMARGEMVRFMAENQITEVEQIKEFTGLGYCYKEELSSEKEIVFIKHDCT